MSNKMDFSKFKKSTTAVWGGEGDLNVSGAVTTPIVNSVAFAYNDVEKLRELRQVEQNLFG